MTQSLPYGKIKCFDGVYRNHTKIIGRCTCHLHIGYISEDLLKKHKCIEKGCYYFFKYESAPYWQTVINAKKEKEISKKKQRKAEEKKAQILLLAANLVEYNDSIMFLNATSTENQHTYRLTFISLKQQWIKELPEIFKDRLSVGIYLKRVTYDREAQLKLLQNKKRQMPKADKETAKKYLIETVRYYTQKHIKSQGQEENIFYKQTGLCRKTIIKFKNGSNVRLSTIKKIMLFLSHDEIKSIEHLYTLKGLPLSIIKKLNETAIDLKANITLARKDDSSENTTVYFSFSDYDPLLPYKTCYKLEVSKGLYSKSEYHFNERIRLNLLWDNITEDFQIKDVH